MSPAQVGPVTFLDQTTGQVYNPTRWEYTSETGAVYIIDDTSGLESVTDSNGNVETFTAAGVQSSSGAGLEITRDSLGRVTSVTDPMNHVTTYQYDSYGNLVAVTDPWGTSAVTRTTRITRSWKPTMPWAGAARAMSMTRAGA